MNKSIPILLVALITLTTCGPDIKFAEPQPKGVSSLKKIPSLYFGRFKGLADSTYIIIDSVSVKKEWRTTELIPLDSLEKELKISIKSDTTILVKDNLLLDKTSESLLLTINLCNDSAKVRVKGYETLFAISDSQQVRHYHKFCFLNYKTRDGYWLVKSLNLKGDLLSYSDLIDSKEIENIYSITKVITVKDTSNRVVEYRINPTRKELRRIIRKKKIENGYKRI
ncbi:MAG: hypothetical protein EHM93_00720 [Bacteroidales bacterium]|nr:MAG: hypothetical protein EHM93_00720 [Bacteroidales bacterium]